MLEWLKRLIWKVSKRQKRFGSSNLPHSAINADMKGSIRSYQRFSFDTYK